MSQYKNSNSDRKSAKRISGTGNRTPSFAVKTRYVNRYTISDLLKAERQEWALSRANKLGAVAPPGRVDSAAHKKRKCKQMTAGRTMASCLSGQNVSSINSMLPASVLEDIVGNGQTTCCKDSGG